MWAGKEVRVRTKKVLGRVLCVLGVISLLLAVLLWGFLIDSLVRLPTGFDMALNCDTTMDWYIDPLTMTRLPEGTNMQAPVHLERRIYSVDDEYDSSTGVLREEMKMEIPAIGKKEWGSTYVVDRKTFLNRADGRANSCDPENVVDRSGCYYPVFLTGMTVGSTCTVWRDEVSGPVTATCVGEDDYDGIEALIVSYVIPIEERREVNPYIIEVLDLPEGISFTEMEKQLSASGVDIGAVLERMKALASPEDLVALEQTMAGTIPVKYYLSCDTEMAVQPRLGSPMDIRRDTERICIEVDQAALMDFFMLLSKYSSDPVIGEGLQKMAALQATLSEPVEVFEFTFGTSRESMAGVLDLTRDALNKVRLLDASPWLLLLLGVVLLVPGVILLRKQ